MWMLLSLLAFGGGASELACIDDTAVLPEGDDQAASYRADMPARSPRYLVPERLETRGLDRYTKAWRDEAGRRWSWSEVRAAWADEPYSRVHLEALDMEQTVARDEAANATARWVDTNRKMTGLLQGELPLDGDIVTPAEFRAERELYKQRMATAAALGAGEHRHVARAMCAFNMAPRLHAEEAAERAAQERMIAEAAEAGGPDGATWNLARMLQETRGAGAPDLADAKAAQRCIQAGKAAGELMSAAETAGAEGSLAAALSRGGLDCAAE